jgi:hypothetical protein
MLKTNPYTPRWFLSVNGGISAVLKAFEYSRLRLIETFLLGRKRYVVIASLESLPARLRAIKGVDQ